MGSMDISNFELLHQRNGRPSSSVLCRYIIKHSVTRGLSANGKGKEGMMFIRKSISIRNGASSC